MRERASMAGGHFEFGAARNGGTRVSVVLPLSEAARVEDAAVAAAMEEP